MQHRTYDFFLVALSAVFLSALCSFFGRLIQGITFLGSSSVLLFKHRAHL